MGLLTSPMLSFALAGRWDFSCHLRSLDYWDPGARLDVALLPVILDVVAFQLSLV